MSQDIVRVLRVIEYVGPRESVEHQVNNSIHGERKYRDVTIRATTIGTYPEILIPCTTSHSSETPEASS